MKHSFPFLIRSFQIFLFTAVLFFAGSGPASALEQRFFSDISSVNSLYSPWIQKMLEANLLMGRADRNTGGFTGIYDPYAMINRAEFTKLAVTVKLAEKYGSGQEGGGIWTEIGYNKAALAVDKLLLNFYGFKNRCVQDFSRPECKAYSDVPAKDRTCLKDMAGAPRLCEPWYSPYIYWADYKGFIKGYTQSDGNRLFKPADNILRIHALKMILADNGNIDPVTDTRYQRLYNVSLANKSIFPKCLSGAENYLLSNNLPDNPTIEQKQDAQRLLEYALLADRLDFFGNDCSAFGSFTSPFQRAAWLQQPLLRKEIPRFFSIAAEYPAINPNPALEPTINSAAENTKTSAAAPYTQPPFALMERYIAGTNALFPPVDTSGQLVLNPITPTEGENGSGQMGGITGERYCAPKFSNPFLVNIIEKTTPLKTTFWVTPCFIGLKAWFAPVSSNGFYLHYNTLHKMIVRENGSADKFSIVYFNDKYQPTLKIEPVYSVFYTYDAQGRLIQEVKTHSNLLIWYENTQTFKQPSPEATITKITWDYTSASGRQIRYRNEYMGSSALPSKVIGYRYLSDDLNAVSALSGNKKAYLEWLKFQHDLIRDIFPDFDFSQFLSGKLSSITINNGIENHFYYNDNLTVSFIEHKKNGLTKNILLPNADMDRIERIFPAINFQVKINQADSKGIAFYIDSEGNIWDATKQVSFNFDGVNSNLVAYYTTGALPIGGGLALSDSPFLPVGDIAGLILIGGALVLDAGIGIYNYATASEAVSITEATTTISYPTPEYDYLTPEVTSTLTSASLLYAFLSLTQVGYITDYISGTLNPPKDPNEYITLYRGDYSGKWSQGFKASGVEKITDLGTDLGAVIFGDLDPVYDNGSLEDMLLRHSENSSFSPFISLTESRAIALKFATGKGFHDGSIYTIRAPKKWIIKNDIRKLSLEEKEWLWPIYIPPFFIANEEPVKAKDFLLKP